MRRLAGDVILALPSCVCSPRAEISVAVCCPVVVSRAGNAVLGKYSFTRPSRVKVLQNHIQSERIVGCGDACAFCAFFRGRRTLCCVVLK